MKKFWNDTFTPATSKNKKQTVVGTLIPITWDRKGRAIRFSIYSDEGEDFIIKEYRYKGRLQRLLNKRVQAIGIVSSNKHDDKFIKLKRIKELTEPSSPSVQVRVPQNGGLWDDEFSINVPKGYEGSEILEPSFSFAS